MHRTLERQLRKMVKNSLPTSAEWKSFLQSVSETYDHADEDRELIERSLELSSQEFVTLSENLEKAKTKTEEEVITRTRELKEEQTRLVASINSLSMGFALFDASGSVVVANSLIGQILGFLAVPVTITDLADVLRGRFPILEQYELCRDEKRSINIPEVIFGKKFVRLFFAPVILHGTNIATVFLIEDITEVKVAERSREEFFAVASHELRTPLTAIRGNMALLRDNAITINNEEKKEIVADTYEASRRLLGIVEDFLNVSRLEQGKITFRQESFNLLATLREAVREVEPLIKSKQLSIVIKTPTVPLPPALADRERTKQIFCNLLGNAINYTEHGTITTEIVSDGKNLAVLFQDTGKGIAPQNQTLLFRKFQPAGEEVLTRDVSKGTGLGLYISKLLAEAMNGTLVLVESILGQGSTFKFSLPAVS